MTRRAICLVVLAAAGIGAQQPPPAGVRVERDIEYAATPEKRLLLDLYRPERPAAEALPLVVWIHGGAWRQGTKANPPAAPLAAQGYVVASIAYRLSQEAIFPAQIHDCKAAIRFLRARAADYGIDPRRIGVWGSSAGGHLVALLGTSGGVADLEGAAGAHLDQSSRVQAVVDFFGPTDFLQMDARSLSSRIVHDAPDSPESQLLGGSIQSHPARAARANPITYVSAADPPFLIVHGDLDPLVPHHQSELLLAALRNAGVTVEFHTVAGGGHGQGGEFGTPALFARVKAFLDQTLAPGPR